MRKISTSKRKVKNTIITKDVDRLVSPPDVMMKRIFDYARSHKVVKSKSVGSIDILVN